MALQQRNSEMVQLLSADFLPNRYPLTLYGTFGGFARVEVSLPNTTAVTLISDSETYDVKVLLHYEALVAIDGGGYAYMTGEMTPTATTAVLYTDVDGSITLACSADGVATIYASGTVTGRVQIELNWI